MHDPGVDRPGRVPPRQHRREADRDEHRPEHEAVRIRSGESEHRRADAEQHETSPSRAQRRRGRGRGGAWMSRMAWMTLKRAMRMLDATMVTIEIASPIANPVITVDAVEGEREVQRSHLASRSEDLVRPPRDEPSEGDPEHRAERAGDHRVEPTLGGETADEQRPPHAHRAEHAELRATLVGEHHEDVDEQEDPGGDREHPDGEVELRQRFAGGVREVEKVALHRSSPRGDRPRADGRSRPPRPSTGRLPTSTPPVFENASTACGGSLSALPTARRECCGRPGRDEHVVRLLATVDRPEPGDPAARQHAVDGERGVAARGERR